jgi:hypothetical protein
MVDKDHLSTPEGRAEAVKGEQRALFGAKIKSPNWPKWTKEWLVRFIEAFPGRRFSAEDVRLWSEEHEPALKTSENRASGSMWRWAQETENYPNIVRCVDTGHHKAKNCHDGIIRIYEAVPENIDAYIKRNRLDV